MAGKKYPMSLSMSLETKELLESAAKKEDISTSELVRQLIDAFGVGRDDVGAVVLQMPLEIKELLENAAKRKDISTSEFIKQLIHVFGLGRDDVKSVVLQIPVDLLKNKTALNQWLDEKKSAILHKLT
jgi:predicted DNA-binding protein